MKICLKLIGIYIFCTVLGVPEIKSEVIPDAYRRIDLTKDIHKQAQDISKRRKEQENKDFHGIKLEDAKKNLQEIQENKRKAEYLKNIAYELAAPEGSLEYFKEQKIKPKNLVTSLEQEYTKYRELEERLLRESGHAHDLAFMYKEHNPEILTNISKKKLKTLGLKESFEPATDLKTTVLKGWNKLQATFKEAELWIRKKLGDELGAKKTADALITLYHFLEDDIGKLKAGRERIQLEKDAEKQLEHYKHWANNLKLWKEFTQEEAKKIAALEYQSLALSDAAKLSDSEKKFVFIQVFQMSMQGNIPKESPVELSKKKKVTFAQTEPEKREYELEEGEFKKKTPGAAVPHQRLLPPEVQEIVKKSMDSQIDLNTYVFELPKEQFEKLYAGLEKVFQRVSENFRQKAEAEIRKERGLEEEEYLKPEVLAESDKRAEERFSFSRKGQMRGALSQLGFDVQARKPFNVIYQLEFLRNIAKEQGEASWF